MPKYVYSAKKFDGEKIKGSIEAKNKGAAISQLRKQENFCDIAVYLEGEIIEITNCPACQGKVSSQAGACPHCGHPIHSNSHHLKNANFSSGSSGSGVNINEGICMLIAVAVLCILMVGGYPGFLFIIGCLGYLFLWGCYVVSALKRNDIGQVILLIFLPVIGIIISALLSPVEKNTLKDSK